MINLSSNFDDCLRSSNQALDLLSEIQVSQEADGKIVILDTLKKFVPVLDKSTVSRTFDVFRRFASAGGTVILLGHTNKNRDSKGKLIFEGVGDLRSDVDNLYGFEPLHNKFSDYQELLVINEKDRQQESFEGGFKYRQTSSLLSYKESINSVSRIFSDEFDRLKKQNTANRNAQQAWQKYRNEFFFIQDNMKNGEKVAYSDLMDFCDDKELNPNCVSKKRLRNCMDLLKGNHLKEDRVGERNRQYFTWQRDWKV